MKGLNGPFGLVRRIVIRTMHGFCLKISMDFYVDVSWIDFVVAAWAVRRL